MRTQTFDYDLRKISIEAQQDFYDNKPKELVGANLVKRNDLFFTRRYRLGSYKAVKAGISRPSVTMAYCGDKFRLYGTPDDNKLFGAQSKSSPVKSILAGWKARDKARVRALKLTTKKNKN